MMSPTKKIQLTEWTCIFIHIAAHLVKGCHNHTGEVLQVQNNKESTIKPAKKKVHLKILPETNVESCGWDMKEKKNEKDNNTLLTVAGIPLG